MDGLAFLNMAMPPQSCLDTSIRHIPPRAPGKGTPPPPVKPDLNEFYMENDIDAPMPLYARDEPCNCPPGQVILDPLAAISGGATGVVAGINGAGAGAAVPASRVVAAGTGVAPGAAPGAAMGTGTPAGTGTGAVAGTGGTTGSGGTAGTGGTGTAADAGSINTAQQTTASSASPNNSSLIAGVVGGAIGAVLVIAAILFLWLRRRRKMQGLPLMWQPKFHSFLVPKRRWADDAMSIASWGGGDEEPAIWRDSKASYPRFNLSKPLPADVPEDATSDYIPYRGPIEDEPDYIPYRGPIEPPRYMPKGVRTLFERSMPTAPAEAHLADDRTSAGGNTLLTRLNSLRGSIKSGSTKGMSVIRSGSVRRKEPPRLPPTLTTSARNEAEKEEEAETGLVESPPPTAGYVSILSPFSGSFSAFGKTNASALSINTAMASAGLTEKRLSAGGVASRHLSTTSAFSDMSMFSPMSPAVVTSVTFTARSGRRSAKFVAYEASSLKSRPTSNASTVRPPAPSTPSTLGSPTADPRRRSMPGYPGFTVYAGAVEARGVGHRGTLSTSGDSARFPFSSYADGRRRSFVPSEYSACPPSPLAPARSDCSEIIVHRRKHSVPTTPSTINFGSCARTATPSIRSIAPSHFSLISTNAHPNHIIAPDTPRVVPPALKPHTPQHAPRDPFADPSDLI